VIGARTEGRRRVAGDRDTSDTVKLKSRMMPTDLAGPSRALANAGLGQQDVPQPQMRFEAKVEACQA
jgi:hypothetical protein